MCGKPKLPPVALGIRKSVAFKQKRDALVPFLDTTTISRSRGQSVLLIMRNGLPSKFTVPGVVSSSPSSAGCTGIAQMCKASCHSRSAVQPLPQGQSCEPVEQILIDLFGCKYQVGIHLQQAFPNRLVLG
jgi:hypothetical protein